VLEGCLLDRRKRQEEEKEGKESPVYGAGFRI